MEMRVVSVADGPAAELYLSGTSSAGARGARNAKGDSFERPTALASDPATALSVTNLEGTRRSPA
jgi:hypothetical protein